MISVLEMIPDSKPKLSHLYTLSQSKLLENHINLHSGSYMYLLIAYMAVPPPPLPGKYVLLYVWHTYFQNTAVVHKYHQCYKMVRTCTISHQCYLLLKSVLIRFLWEFFWGGFNRRCSYDRAVSSKFLPHIFSCGCPYDVTQQVS